MHDHYLTNRNGKYESESGQKQTFRAPGSGVTRLAVLRWRLSCPTLRALAVDTNYLSYHINVKLGFRGTVFVVVTILPSALRHQTNCGHLFFLYSVPYVTHAG